MDKEREYKLQEQLSAAADAVLMDVDKEWHEFGECCYEYELLATKNEDLTIAESAYAAVLEFAIADYEEKLRAYAIWDYKLKEELE